MSNQIPAPGTAQSGAVGMSMRPKRVRPRIAQAVPGIVPLASVALFLVVWELSSGTLISSYFIASPSAVWQQLIAWAGDGYLAKHLVATLSGVALSFVVASIVGVGLAVVLGSSRTADRVLYPFVVGGFTIPRIALAPLFIVWFGVGFVPAVALGVLTAFFMVFFNAYSGIRNTSQALLDISQILGASRIQRALKFRLPASAPFVFEGLRVGAIYAFHGVVVGEIVASSTGLGYVIIYSATRANPAGVFAGLVVIGLLATVFVAALNWAQRHTPG
ncbi:MAG: ABC transporter permease subunit [Actinobacteria bacterium]|nr:ABC transporter permease subunit [Actinomycetota bacterium]